MKSFIKSLFYVTIIISFTTAQNDRLVEAKKYIEQREFELAKPILEFLYEQDEENAEVNYWFGVFSLMQNNYDDAIDYIEVAIESDAKNHLYYNMLGNAYGRKAQNSGAFKAAFAAPKAKSNWEKAVELKPDFIDAKQALFQYYLQAPGIMGGDDEKALQIANEFIKLNPSLGHLSLANYYLVAEENYEKTEVELQQSIKVDTLDTLYNRINRGNINLLNTLGYSYLNNKDYPKSKKAFSQAILIAPDQPNPHDSMGDYYVAVAKYDSALLCYENALINDSNFVASKFNKGKILEQLNRKEEAILVYKELLMHNSEGRYVDAAEDRLDELE